jgi:hypothetical protein
MGADHWPQSSSASRFTALILSQSGERKKRFMCFARIWFIVARSLPFLLPSSALASKNFAHV